MLKHQNASYQSGEKVPFNGTFEVVGVRLAYPARSQERAVCDLKAGEAFAAYEGIEFCWHFVVGSSIR
jgi:hypothetical protein